MKASNYYGAARLLILIAMSWCSAANAQTNVELEFKTAWPGRARGTAYNVQVVGLRAYVAQDDQGLAIYDISNPTNLICMGGYGCCGTRASDVQVMGDLAYVGFGSDGLHIVDVSRPNRPVPLFRGPHEGANAVRVVGNRAYIAGSFFSIYDVSQPTNAVRLAGFISVSPVQDIQVVGNLAYLASQGGLTVYDVSQPANPVPVGSQASATGYYGIQIIESYMLAFVAAGSSGVQLLDIADPNNIRPIGSPYDYGTARGLQLVGDKLYVADGEAGITIYQHDTLTTLARLSTFNAGQSAFGLDVIGDRAYIADAIGLQVLDVSNPTNCARLGGMDKRQFPFGSGRAVQVGSVAYVAYGPGGLQVLDVSNPTNLVWLGSFDTGGDASDVELIGPRAYVTDTAAGLKILDVSNPAQIAQLGAYDTPGYAYAVRVINGRAYVCDDGQGIHILDVTDPAHVVRLGGYDTPGGAQDVEVIGNRAYVADTSGGLQILDVTQPTNVVWLGGTGAILNAKRLQVAGSFAYITGTGLEIFNISNPTNITRIAQYTGYNFPATVVDVKLSGNVAYTVCNGDGLIVLDVSDPTNVVRLAAYSDRQIMRHPHGVSIFGDRVFVADELGDISVLQIKGVPPAPPQLAFPQMTAGQFQSALNGLPFQGEFVLESSTDLIQWGPVQTNTITGPNYPLSFSTAPGEAARYFRAKLR